ncbi:Predicted peroxiredoxin [Neorhodopirellula lusitana]|uniref:Predicted peroxiredoxin n=1 Tax=Neorhodopirellula lusitana TaxID=445327 RepID=A0ABY1Q8B4_9BACT|nr:DsrE family protein [Neorhodopirellula lusitana]SMP58821.1 Predicted peroxiredoxin [Neorhodopirellula lusitana]
MSGPSEHVVVILTVGKADNGKNATMAFSCGLSSLAMGRPTAVFLTSDGAVWGYTGSSEGIVVQGFPALSELIKQYIEAGGRIILCSVCHRTCSVGGPGDLSAIERLPEIEIGGFATVLDLAIGGTTISF